MHIPKAALANIDFNLDVLDEVKAIIHIKGLDAETARVRAEDAFAGLELNETKRIEDPSVDGL